MDAEQEPVRLQPTNACAFCTGRRDLTHRVVNNIEITVCTHCLRLFGTWDKDALPHSWRMPSPVGEAGVAQALKPLPEPERQECYAAGCSGTVQRFRTSRGKEVILAVQAISPYGLDPDYRWRVREGYALKPRYNQGLGLESVRFPHFLVCATSREPQHPTLAALWKLNGGKGGRQH